MYSPFKAIEKKLIGGVTLNHLSWAALGGGKCINSLWPLLDGLTCSYCTVRSGLLALQGEDELGQFIRTNLKKLGVETAYIKGQQFN